MRRFSLMLLGFLNLVSLLLLALPVSASQMAVDISISRNDIVSEHIILEIDGEYDVVEYRTLYVPVSIAYDGDYVISVDDGYYVITFPGRERTEFTLVYDDMVDRNFGRRVFRTSFDPGDIDRIDVRLSLPEHFVLSEDPSAVPRPDMITTDGQRIILAWAFDQDAQVSVFYEDESDAGWMLVIAAVVLVSVIVVLLLRKKGEKRVTDTLSDEEKKIMDKMSCGVKRQDEIARQLGFSKSKMSKVVRKLEEKGLVEKKPHFKTNILLKK